MGIGNWIVAFWEDWRSHSFLGQAGGSEANWIMYLGYSAHHTVAMFAFTFCLCTRKLTGLCAMGMLFEAPFVLATWRELALTREEAPRWMGSRLQVQWLYFLTFVLFAIARGGPTGLYFFAVSD